MATSTKEHSSRNGVITPPDAPLIRAAVQITAPKIHTAQFKIVGTSPYVQLRFSEKAMNAMAGKMEDPTAKSKKKRDPRNWDEDFRQALHISQDGWYGIPASAFRNTMISACKLVGFAMTRAKLSIFILHDGLDVVDQTPLIKIDGTPTPVRHAVRNATGVADLRVRASFSPWTALLNVQYDAEQFTQQDVANLLMRAGVQVGIGEGRPDSKNSNGMGFGTFELEAR